MPVTRQAAAALMTSPARRRQPMPPDDERDYEVGYGKPPRHTRFGLGRSGNPRGRPGGSKKLSTLLSEALKEPVIVVENGRRRKDRQASGHRHPAGQSVGQSRFEGHSDPADDAPRP